MATAKKGAKSDAKATKAAAGSKEKDAKAGKDDDKSKRKLGLRGAAPWAARHAAKHAAEARARAAEPPLPGSARATIRTPSGAEDIKVKIGELHNALVLIKSHRKNLGKGFYDIGNILKDIQIRKLYEAKGYGSFEAFLEREIDLGKVTSLRLVKIVTTFLKDAALEYGMDRTFNAMVSLETIAEDNLGGQPASKTSSNKVPPPPLSSTALPMKPPGR